MTKHQARPQNCVGSIDRPLPTQGMTADIEFARISQRASKVMMEDGRSQPSSSHYGPEPDLRCRLSRDHKQRSARRTLQRPLSCLAPQAPAFSLDGFRGIADMIVGPPGTTSGVARSVLADCLFRTHAHVLVWSIQWLAVGAVLWDELPH
jgi:hypothetical protein